MSKRGDRESLSDIVEAIERIQAHTKGISYERFLSDIKTQDAVVRNLEVIGEAFQESLAGFQKTAQGH